jgi:hypothetical protein
MQKPCSIRTHGRDHLAAGSFKLPTIRNADSAKHYEHKDQWISDTDIFPRRRVRRASPTSFAVLPEQNHASTAGVAEEPVVATESSPLSR